MPPVVVAEILRRVRGGERFASVAGDVGVSIQTITRAVRQAGGMSSRWKDRSPFNLSAGEREEISRALSEGLGVSAIALRLGRHKSTISRELQRNGGAEVYRAWRADRRACAQARRPKPRVLEENGALDAYVEEKLQELWSPQQIAARLRAEFPDDEGMRVSHETIYQTLFVQGRGGLRKELAACLRSGRKMRKSHGRTSSTNAGRIPDMVPIVERPAEANDRAVPGHWEGDLILGKDGKSAIATLVERASRFVMLGALPEGRTADKVREALTQLIQRLPEQLRRSLAWDQGSEMAQHVTFTIDSGVQVYFCDPHSPWQRGSNENTNGLLRQYFPKGTSLARHTQDELDAVAAQLNGRPRQTLNWLTPSEALQQFVALAA
jgi:IS30 family transposase